MQDSKTIDPIGGFERRIVPYDRGNFRLGLRQDLPTLGLSAGFNFRAGIEGNRKIIDIDKVDTVGLPRTLNLFVEKRGFAGLLFRFDANNVTDGERCRPRKRYAGSLAKGIVSEYEFNCNITGAQYIFTMRRTFQ